MLHGAFSECLMLRRALVVWLAFLLLAHGIAHVPGFLVNWQIASFPDLTYRTTIFGTSVDVGPEGIRLLGLCWIGTAIVLVLLASAVAFNVPLRPWAIPAALILSLLLCAAGWPEARLGLVANVVIAVGTWLQRDIAERAAAGAPGIRRVDNLITVEPPIEKEED